MGRFSSSFRRSASLLFACATIAACHGAIPNGSGDFLPGQLAPNSLVPHHLHVIPFQKSQKWLGTSEGQKVYALFGLPSVGKTKGSLLAYGASAINGNAGPLTQITLVASSTNAQHVYVHSNGKLAEVIDKATGLIVLVTYPKAGETLTYVCQGRKELGTIEEIGTKTIVTKKGGTCPSKLQGHSQALPEFVSDASSAPSAANVKYDVCAMSAGALPSAASIFSKGGKIDASLTALGKTYAELSAYLAAQCNAGVTLGAPQKSPCQSKTSTTCTYMTAPVPIVVSGATCGTSLSTFYEPGQTCVQSIAYNVSSSTPYTVTTSNSSAVTASPSSGSVNGSGTLKVTLTAGSAGTLPGTATVTVAIGSGQSVYLSVQNDWNSSATPPPYVTVYPLTTGVSNPHGITVGPDKAIWFTEFDNNKIGRITTTGSIIEYNTTTTGLKPESITSGPDGALWFTARCTCSSANSSQIGRISTTGTVMLFSTPANTFADGIAAGPDGALWFADQNGYIDRMTTTGSVTSHAVASSGAPAPGYIVAGSDGALWFTELQNSSVGRITTTGTITVYGLGMNSEPEGIALGHDGNVWVNDYHLGVIDRVTTAGVVTPFTSPLSSTLGVGDVAITAGPDGAMWFGTSDISYPIGCLAVSGSVPTWTYPASIPASYTEQAYDIVTGPDGALWYTDPISNAIIRVNPAIVNALKMHQGRDTHR